MHQEALTREREGEAFYVHHSLDCASFGRLAQRPSKRPLRNFKLSYH